MCVMSLISLAVSVIGTIIYSSLFLGSGLTILFIFISVTSVIFPSCAKLVRLKRRKKGKALEIIALVLGGFNTYCIVFALSGLPLFIAYLGWIFGGMLYKLVKYSESRVDNLKVGSDMYCRYCVSPIPDNSIFCPKCGKQLSNEDTKDNATSAISSEQQVDVLEVEANTANPAKEDCIPDKDADLEKQPKKQVSKAKKTIMAIFLAIACTVGILSLVDYDEPKDYIRFMKKYYPEYSFEPIDHYEVSSYNILKNGKVIGCIYQDSKFKPRDEYVSGVTYKLYSDDSVQAIDAYVTFIDFCINKHEKDTATAYNKLIDACNNLDFAEKADESKNNGIHVFADKGDCSIYASSNSSGYSLQQYVDSPLIKHIFD